MLAPLSIINHYRPSRRPSPGFTLDELYPEGFHERDLRLAKDPQWFTWRNFFLGLDGFVKGVENLRLRPFRRLALKRAENWMVERFEGSNGLAATFTALLNSIIAMRCLGYKEDHPLVVNAEKELKSLEHETRDSVRIEPCFSPVWDTVIALIALRNSGVEETTPEIKKAVDWVVEKEIRFRGDWKYKNPVDVEPSGWVFEFENKWYPDVDDTAMALLALKGAGTDNPDARDAAYQRGLDWMMTFQCK